VDENKFPEKYDLREEGRVTPIKEQGGIGSCWALTSIAAVESSLLTSEKKEYDLSENNMITQLSSIYEYGFDRDADSGGDDALAAAYYAAWNGPVLEKEDTYPKSMRSKDIKYRTGVKPIKHIQEIVFLPERKDPYDNDFIKEYIMKYGAVSASTWKGTEQTFGEFYNEETFAWYYPYKYMNKEGHGHAINIVGWDDNYPKENFKIEPKGDGAFIARNTKGALWGQRDRKENMGGYFYISYYDMMTGTKLDSNIGNSVITRIDDVNNYDHIYQYDILGYTKKYHKGYSGRSVWFSNAFEINKGTNESLAAVSFYTLEENLDYEIYIVKNCKDESSFNKLKKINSGSINLPGYHTIDLDKKIELKGNEKIGVAVKLTSKTSNPSIAIESPKGIMSSKAKANSGESFIKYGTWKDITKLEKGSNVCLKIFTKDNKTKEDTLSAQQMKRDVDFIVEWILNHQPVAVETGYTKEQQEIIDMVYENIKTPKTEKEFYLLINRLFTMMNDGHTNMHYRSDHENYLNIPFVWLEEGLVVNKCAQKYLKGDKVLSIGGKTPHELEKMLKEQISCENQYWIRACAPDVLTREMFLKYFNLANDNGTVDIEIKREGKELIFKEPLENTISSFMFSQPAKWKEWHIEKNNNMGYFRFDEWPTGDMLEELKKEMDKFFKEVAEKHIDNIVFDIRKNPGGCAGILNYLLTYLDTNTIYVEEYEEYINLPKVDDNLLFKGNTYVMTSNESYSCSVFGTMILKDNGIAKTIGEPTGENPAFNRHGEGSDGKLPETGWSFMMTSYKPQRPMDKNETESAIFPDIPVYTTREDIVLGIDPQMEKMREIARRDKNTFYHEKTIACSSDEEWILKEGNKFQVNNKNKTIFIDKKLDIGSIFIEDTEERNRTKINFTKEKDVITFKIPKSCVEGKCYHINFQFANGDIEAVRQVVKAEIKIESEFFIISREPYNFVAKYNYLVISFSKDIAKTISKRNVTLTEEDGKKYCIDCFSRGCTCYYCLIIKPYKELEKGKYSLFIPKGTIKSVDGEVYDEDICTEFLVK
jgi:C1A family cysteine protease/C-terminal processing protease CtpA/Prc